MTIPPVAQFLKPKQGIPDPNKFLGRVIAPGGLEVPADVTGMRTARRAPILNFEGFVHEMLNPTKPIQPGEKVDELEIRPASAFEQSAVGRVVSGIPKAIAHLPKLPLAIAEAFTVIPYRGIKEFLTETNVVDDALKTIATTIAPIHPAAAKEIMDEIKEKDFKSRLREFWGRMSPEEAEQARRTFYAFLIAHPTFSVAKSVVRGALTPQFARTGFADFPVDPMAVLRARSQAEFYGTLAGGQAAAAMFAGIESVETEDFPEKLAFFSIQMAPFGVAYWLNSKVYGNTRFSPSESPSSAGAEAAQLRAIRAFDDQPLRTYIEPLAERPSVVVEDVPVATRALPEGPRPIPPERQLTAGRRGILSEDPETLKAGYHAEVRRRLQEVKDVEIPRLMEEEAQLKGGLPTAEEVGGNSVIYDNIVGDIDIAESRIIKTGVSYDDRLTYKMGETMYSGNIGSVATKELVQNGTDAIRGVLGATVRVEGQLEKNYIKVVDDGIGMDSETATKTFLGVGGTYKPFEHSTGGFGFAKVGLFLKAERFIIKTVGRSKETGKLEQTYMEGSGDKWMAKDIDAIVDDVPEGTPTGTTVELWIQPNLIAPWTTAAMLKRIQQYSLMGDRILGTLSPLATMGEESTVPKAAIDPKMASGSVPGADYDVYPSSSVADLTRIELHILNNGLYQFTTGADFNGRGPSFLIIDIKPTTDVENSLYPFQGNREALRGPAKEVIDHIVRNAAVDAAKVHKKVVQDALNSGADYSIKIGEKTYADFKVIDEVGNLGKELIKSIAESRYILDLSAPILEITSRLNNKLDEAMTGLKVSESGELVPSGSVAFPVAFAGIGIAENQLGVNIQQSGALVNLVFINPFGIYNAVAAKNIDVPLNHFSVLLARKTLGTVVHEIVHNVVRHHERQFGTVVNELFENLLGEEMINKAYNDLVLAWHRTQMNDKFSQHRKLIRKKAKEFHESVFQLVGVESSARSPVGGSEAGSPIREAKTDITSSQQEKLGRETDVRKLTERTGAAGELVAAAARALSAGERSGINLVSSILQIHSKMLEKEVVIIPGVAEPITASKLAKGMSPNMIVAVHKRDDGLYDIAVGRAGSKLKGHQAQFADQGFYQGQSVIVDGQHYIYKTGAGKDKAVVNLPGRAEPLLVPFDQLRRAPWVSESQIAPLDMDLLKESLPAEEFSMFEKFLNDTYGAGKEVPTLTPEESIATNSFYLQKNVTGGWTLRDKVTGRRVAEDFKTQEDALKFVNESGQQRGPDFIPPNIDDSGVGNLLPPEPPTNPPGEVPQPSYYFGFSGISKIVTAMNASSWGRYMTTMRNHFKALDDIFKLNLHNDLMVPLMEAASRADRMAGEFLSTLEKEVVEPLKGAYGNPKKVDERLGIMGEYWERLTYDEMIRDGIAESRRPTPIEIDISNKFAAVNLDTRKVLNFRAAVRSALQVEAVRRSRIEKTRITVNELPETVVKDIRDVVARASGLMPTELKAAELFEQVEKLPMDEVDIAHIVMLTEAKLNPTATISKADFAKLHKMTPLEIKLAEKMGDYFRRFAVEEFDIPEYRLFRFYLSHMRQYGDAGWAGQPATGAFGKIRNFAAEYVRTGEVDAYDTNMFRNLFEYVRAGYRNREFKPVYEELTERTRVDLINKGIPQESYITRSVREFTDAIRGVPVESGTFTEYMDAFFKKIGLQSTDKATRIWLNATNSGAMGLRPGMGIRDFADFNTKLFVKMGPARFRSAYEALTLETINALKKEGKIGGLTTVEYMSKGEYNVRDKGAIERGFQRMADVGLQLSLQPLVYDMAQAAAYMDMFITVPKVLNKLHSEILGTDIRDILIKPNPRSREIDASPKARAYEDIGIFKFDIPERIRFDELIRAGKMEQAADYIGKMSALDMVGRYGLGQTPYGWRSNTGRLITQFGMWSANTKDYIFRGLAFGSQRDRRRFLARLAMTYGANKAAQAATGLNFTRWRLTPGIFFLGGPVTDIPGIIAGIAGGDGERRRNDAIRDLSSLVPFFNLVKDPFSRLGYSIEFTPDDPRAIWLPYSYMASDWIQAFTDPRIDNMMEFTGRALGIPVMQPRLR